MFLFILYVTHASNASSTRSLAVFSLVRGGADVHQYVMFLNSRRCLRSVMPSVISYDNVAFHEGNVPQFVQRELEQQMYELVLTAV